MGIMCLVMSLQYKTPLKKRKANKTYYDSHREQFHEYYLINREKILARKLERDRENNINGSKITKIISETRDESVLLQIIENEVKHINNYAKKIKTK